MHFENEQFVGRTNFHAGLLTSIILLGVKDVEGVERMSRSGFRVKRLFNKSARMGVLVNFDFDGVVIDLWIRTVFGYSAADVSYRVQESVIAAVAGFVDANVKAVNVMINGVGGRKRETKADVKAKVNIAKAGSEE